MTSPRKGNGKQLLSLTEASQLFGINRILLGQRLKDGTLTAHSNPFDRRQKLLDRDEIESLMRGITRGKEVTKQ